MILEAVVALTVAVTGHTCAAIDNETNKAVWAAPDVPLVATTYEDWGVIVYNDAPRPHEVDAWVALHAAEEALVEGAPGRKIPVRCIAP